MKRIYVLCCRQFARLVLPMPDDCRSEGAEAVRAASVVAPSVPLVAGLELGLQSMEPSDPSWLPSNRGEEELVLQPLLSALVACPWADAN